MPQGTFFRMVRACRITRRRPDSAIFFVDEVFVTQAFIAAVTPLTPYLLMQVFGKCFCQTVRQSLRHDCVVVVVFGSEPVAKRLEADSTSHRESPDVIRQTRFFRG